MLGREGLGVSTWGGRCGGHSQDRKCEVCQTCFSLAHACHVMVMMMIQYSNGPSNIKVMRTCISNEHAYYH